MSTPPQHLCTFLRGQNWYTYKHLENRLLEVSKHITFDPQNHDTWSENLASLLILTGSAVDTFFRDMKDCSCVQKEISFVNVSQKVGRGRWDINDFRDAYEPIYEFSQNEIHVPFGLSSYPPIKPFNEFQSKGIPDWWDAYNGVKHEYYHSIRRATLDNVLNALGGLLILHALHKLSLIHI